VLIDGRGVPDGTRIESDLCIIGGGAAGITLAREFAGGSTRVCLLESGGLEFDAATQDLAAGENIGVPYPALQTARLRYFGGSTNHWEGWCRPLDPEDFEPRPWIADSGWPVRVDELMPHLERAAEVCRIGTADHRPAVWNLGEAGTLALDAWGIETRLIQYDEPTRFGRVYRPELENASNVQVYLSSNVTQIHLHRDGGEATHVSVRCLTGTGFKVTARAFVLAAGGLENPRLLLLSDDVQKRGLGNEHDLVGRYFANHLYVRSGAAVLSRPPSPLDLYTARIPAHPSAGADKTVPVTAYLKMSPTVQEREKLTNVSVNLRSSDWGSYLIDPYFESLWGGDREEWEKNFRLVVRNLDELTVASARKALSAVSLAERHPLVELLNLTEQAPNPESRVLLGDSRDRLGQRRIKLDWRLLDVDLRSIQRAQELLAGAFADAGVGRFIATFQVPVAGLPDEFGGDWHHMGTTRMHDDPRHGVVDRNCRLHTVSNVYIAGSSVFTTAGYSNPTLTLVALALRLADHFKQGVLKS
jgi:choline dehydrogenase-like flavoprotein